MAEKYISDQHCLDSDLFLGTWRDAWLDIRFLELKRRIEAGATLDELKRDDLIREEFPEVYSLPFFNIDFCSKLTDETEHFISYALENDVPIHRPNSMNRYGLVLNLIGMKETLTSLQQNHILPVSRFLYRLEGSHFTTDHHTFIVSYEPSKDRLLDMHTDDSDVTWNVCLGKEGFVGSGLTFCGKIAEANHRKLTGHYSHMIGRAVVHLGSQRHGADVIVSGERHNMIMWCKNEAYRNSDVFRARMMSYAKESGPPDEVCLSYTHDRDYITFKEYPPGTNPYSMDSDASGEDDSNAEEECHHHRPMPWCPPAKFGYDGIPSHNELMLLHFRKAVAKEKEMKKRKLESGKATAAPDVDKGSI